MDQVQGPSGAAGYGTEDRAGDKATVWVHPEERVKVRTKDKLQCTSKESFREGGNL